jgi:hypothetical protein
MELVSYEEDSSGSREGSVKGTCELWFYKIRKFLEQLINYIL